MLKVISNDKKILGFKRFKISTHMNKLTCYVAGTHYDFADTNINSLISIFKLSDELYINKQDSLKFGKQVAPSSVKHLYSLASNPSADEARNLSDQACCSRFVVTVDLDSCWSSPSHLGNIPYSRLFWRALKLANWSKNVIDEF